MKGNPSRVRRGGPWLATLSFTLWGCASSGGEAPPAGPAPVPVAQAVEAGELGLPETPFTVAPKIQSADEYRRLLAEAYPPIHRDAGIAGAATLLVAVSAEGRVLDRRIHESSGDTFLDQAALRVGQAMEFTPASNEGSPVPVWVTVEILFDARAAPAGRAVRRVIRS